MVGEDQANELQKGDNSEAPFKYSYADYLAEDEDSGTGIPTNKNHLTDVDYQAGNEFTSYNGGDDFAIATDDENEGESDDIGEDEYDDSDYEDSDDYDENEDDDDDEDDENEEDVEEGDSSRPSIKDTIKDKGRELVGDIRDDLKAVSGNQNLFDGFIKWHPGQPITLALLTKLWSELPAITQIKPLVATADEFVKQALAAATAGPNLTINFAVWVKKFFDSDAGYISGVLSIIDKFSHKLIYTGISVVESLFLTQQWLEVGIIAGLGPAMELALKTEPVLKILTAIFMVAVPIINFKYLKKMIKSGAQAVKKKVIQHKIKKRKKKRAKEKARANKSKA